MSKIQTLLDLLHLEQIEQNIFRGESRDVGSPRVFGGQVLAQALSAANATVEPDRRCHSLHAYFILPGDVNAPIVFEIDRIRDGRSFTTRRIVAIQHGRPIFNMSASFQLVQEGIEHQDEMPKVVGPDNLASLADYIEMAGDALPDQVRKIFGKDSVFIFKPVEFYNDLKPEKMDPVRHIWFKANGEIPNDPALHRSILTYVSDFYLLGTCLQPHGLSFMLPNVTLASLDHAVWFHREFRADEWLLYALDSPNASMARGFCRGNVFTQDGVLVASVAQQGMVRVKEVSE